MFVWLESSKVAIWVAESVWAYPFWLALHVTGFAIVVGLFTVRDLRLLGFFDGLSLGLLLRVSRFAWGGFIVNATSGGFLFTAQATTFVDNTPFLLKITCIASALVLARLIEVNLSRALIAGNESTSVTSTTKTMAAASLVFWVSAVIAGRLIAYF